MSKTKAQLALHLSLIKGVGPALCKRLHDTLASEFENLYRYDQKVLISLGFSDQTAQMIVQGLADCKMLERELSLIEQHKINIVTLFDNEYPSLLKEIHL